MKRHLTLLALALAFGPCRGAAQGPLRLEPGARVRLSAPALTPGKFTGNVVAMDTAWLHLAPSDSAGERWVRLALVDTVEVSHGSSRVLRALRGGSWGAFVGIGLGTIAGALAARELPLGIVGSAAAGAAGVGAVGTGIGVGVALKRPVRERWRRYVLPRPAPPPPPPPPGGYAPVP